MAEGQFHIALGGLPRKLPSLSILRCSRDWKGSPSPCSGTNSMGPGVNPHPFTGPQFHHL